MIKRKGCKGLTGLTIGAKSCASTTVTALRRRSEQVSATVTVTATNKDARSCASI